MVLGKLPVPGRPINLAKIVGQGPTALVVGTGGDVLTFCLSSIISHFFLPLSGRRPYCLNGPLNPIPTNQPSCSQS